MLRAGTAHVFCWQEESCMDTCRAFLLRSSITVFNGFMLAQSHRHTRYSVPARLGKGQGAKEMGHNLARERPKFGHNLVRKRHKIFYA